MKSAVYTQRFYLKKGFNVMSVVEIKETKTLYLLFLFSCWLEQVSLCTDLEMRHCCNHKTAILIHPSVLLYASSLEWICSDLYFV